MTAAGPSPQQNVPASWWTVPQPLTKAELRSVIKRQETEIRDLQYDLAQARREVDVWKNRCLPRWRGFPA